MTLGLLSALVLAPWAGALVLAALPRLGASASRWLALVFSLSTLLLGAIACARFDPRLPGYPLAESHRAALGLPFTLGLDGTSLVLVLMTGVVAPAGLLISWKSAAHPRVFGLLLLALQGAALGVFLTLDFAPWFLFWELSIVPAYFLIRLWGGPGAAGAAYQFVVYTIGGSAFLLFGFAAIYVAAGTLHFPTLAAMAAQGTLASRLAGLGGIWPKLVFVGIVLGFAVKAPLFPFHTWLPAAYSEAPTGAAMVLTGVLSKMGVYGFLRIAWPFFPGPMHAAAPALLWLSLGGVVFGALAAVVETDAKRMAAYASLNHVSLCLLAIFAFAGAPAGANPSAGAAALGGALLQMVNHGVSAAGLFAVIGVLEARAGGRRGLGDFGGVRTAAPRLALLCGVALFASLGLPGLNGFVGEFFIFRGVWGYAPWAASIACVGLFATAWFLLTFWQRVFDGPRAGAASGAFPDASGSELAALIPLSLLMLLLGVVPGLLTHWFNPLVEQWVRS